MGVKGLWQLLEPAARPIKMENLEGKVRLRKRTLSSFSGKEKTQHPEDHKPHPDQTTPVVTAPVLLPYGLPGAVICVCLSLLLSLAAVYRRC